jgi:hypothetical protein
MLLLAACARAGTARPVPTPAPPPGAPGRNAGTPDTVVSPEEREQLRQVTRDARRMARERTAPDSTTRRLRADSALPTAFADAEARALVALARAARLRQDSALVAYRATTLQRFDVAMGARRSGLEKRLVRGDNVAEIAWRREVGVRVTPVGSRLVSSLGRDTRGTITDAVTIPYFPGRETLWFPSSDFGMVRSDIDERDLIHPLARGAEAYYRYASGDSASITLPDGRVIPLRELRISARRPDRRLFVGSFWFDRRGGELVRAAYRLAAAIEIWDVASEEVARERIDRTVAEPIRDSLARTRLARPLFVKDSVARVAQTARARRGGEDDDAPPAWVTATFRPARAELEGITVEYGLYDGRFWLPRAHSASYRVQFGFLRIPYQLDETFRYQEINAAFPLRPIPASRVARAQGDTVNPGDSTTVVDAPAEILVSIGSGAAQGGSRGAATVDDTTRLTAAQRQLRRLCTQDSSYTRVDSRFDGRLRVAFDLPCNADRLRSAAALPPLDAVDVPGTSATGRDALLEALGLSLQPGLAISRPELAWGTEFLRYNRIEGLSVGAQLRQSLGAGYTMRATGRMGHADRHGNGELALERTGGARTVTATVFHRLAASNPEWAGALTAGASLPPLLYGRDEGFYYRTLGTELIEQRTSRRSVLRSRLFIERQWSAGDTDVVNTFSLARQVSGRQFRTNVIADRVALSGVAVEWTRTWRDVPGAFRFATVVQGEAATGSYAYTRSGVEGTVSRSLGPLAASLTAAAGTATGRIPSQRQWFLGGVRTVRGYGPGSSEGDAFWLGRAELGMRQGIVRPVVFYDAGWAGNRSALSTGPRLQGLGGGVSLIDGLLRFDAARPRRGGPWRVDVYLSAAL